MTMMMMISSCLDMNFFLYVSLIALSCCVTAQISSYDFHNRAGRLGISRIHHENAFQARKNRIARRHMLPSCSNLNTSVPCHGKSISHSPLLVHIRELDVGESSESAVCGWISDDDVDG